MTMLYITISLFLTETLQRYCKYDKENEFILSRRRENDSVMAVYLETKED